MNKHETIDILKKELLASNSLEEVLVEVSIPSACVICGEDATTEISIKELENSGDIADTTAKKLYEEGWREGKSKQFSVNGLMCGDCKKTKDSERG